MKGAQGRAPKIGLRPVGEQSEDAHPILGRRGADLFDEGQRPLEVELGG
jgi:hypothetical protein